MNSLRSGLTVAAIVLGTMTGWAGEDTAANPESTARGTAGYAITAPSGDSWRPSPSAEGEAFVNPVNGRSQFYSAGFSAAPAPAFADRAGFLAYVKLAVTETSDTSRFAKVEDTFTEKEQDGLWVVDCSMDRESGGQSVTDKGSSAPRVTLIRTRYALNPREPGRVLIAWYAFQGTKYEEKQFESEAATFLNSLRQTSQ